jgi:phosphoserine phosphatase
MVTATLLTDPATPALDRTTVEALRNAWGGGDARWLDPGVAAEFPLDAVPGNLWDVWKGLQALGIDLAVQPTAGRRKRLLLADMDSTMIRQECIDELAAMAGVGPQVAGITARAMTGELDVESALRDRVALLAGLAETAIARVLDTRISFTPCVALPNSLICPTGMRIVIPLLQVIIRSSFSVTSRITTNEPVLSVTFNVFTPLPPRLVTR